MKKMIFAAMALTAMLASCSKETENTTNPGNESGGGPQVQVTLAAEDPATRAFFDNTAAAEEWEKEIKSLTVYVFDRSGNLIVKRSLTATEMSAKSARFSLPNSAAGTTCSFYAVANADYGDAATTADMALLMESATLGDYNGTTAQTLTARKRTGGFVMNGKTSQAIAAAGSSTTVGVTLKRTVAKIAVRAKLSGDFTADYNGGTVTITNAVISQANPCSFSFYDAANLYASPFTYTTRQAPDYADGCHRNIFYTYECPAADMIAARPYLTLEGYFDADGMTSTISDRSDVEYKVVLEGSGSGLIVRNGYYRVDVTIKGLSGDGVIVNFTVADWETPVTQTVDLGV